MYVKIILKSCLGYHSSPALLPTLLQSIGLSSFVKDNRESKGCHGDEIGKCTYRYLAQCQHPIMPLKCQLPSGHGVLAVVLCTKAGMTSEGMTE